MHDQIYLGQMTMKNILPYGPYILGEMNNIHKNTVKQCKTYGAFPEQILAAPHALSLHFVCRKSLVKNKFSQRSEDMQNQKKNSQNRSK